MVDHTDFTACYAAVHSRDRRFDGRFVTGVLTTGIYCRPSCPARTPKPDNVRFFASPAAAQRQGLRACRRCRPELAPDAPDNDPAGDLAARALRMIDQGAGEDGVESLAARLFVSPRHLHRILVQTYGAGPAALVRMQRVRLARILVDQTQLPLGRVALAAGFGSVRQFNDAFKQTFRLTPGDVRRGRGDTATAGHGEASITIPVREPFDFQGVLDWAALHQVPTRDQIVDGAWTRMTHRGPVELRPFADGVTITVAIEHVEDLRHAVVLARQVFDTTADIEAAATLLSADPLLAPLITARPGVRVPGAADPFEGCVRVILGQQVSAKGATTLMARLAAVTPPAQRPGLPSPDWLAQAPLESQIGLTRQRAGAIRALGAAVTNGLRLDGAAPEQTLDQLLALPGIGPWTAQTIGLLVLRQPDAWPTGDLALRRAVQSLTGRAITAADLDAMARDWRPWRGYAAVLLWHHYLNLRTAV
ncbi:MAG: Ada metal-binding domain-containing protein [Euzebya sp.]